MFTGNSLRTLQLDDGFVELRFDRSGLPINKLDQATMIELGQAVAVIAAVPGLRGVLITSAKESFIVGADITEFPTLFALSDDAIESAFATANAGVNALEDLPVPSVAAINGLALGGGLEVALAADFRVITDVAQVGFPEVKLGLFPGFGGTVRLPRVANVQVAIDWITTGTPVKAAVAASVGVADEVTTSDELRSSALALLSKAAASEIDWLGQRARKLAPLADSSDSEHVFTEAFAKLAKQSAKHQPAAITAVELMRSSVATSRDAAIKMETASFARNARTQAASSLIQIFLSDQLLRKKAKAHAKSARPVKHAAVLGAGIMGGGIAYTSAGRGTPVLMKDIHAAQLDLGMGEAQKLLAKQVASGRLKQASADAALSAITPQLDYQSFDHVDVVVEAVVESLKIKHLVLSEVELQVRTDTVIASNTSSLRIDDLAVVLKRPENFVGMHFFNPVPLMQLVEVIRGAKTSDVAVSTVVAYAASMGKMPIVVRDGPGFLVNRVLTPYMLAFLQLVREGVDFVRIDQVMEAFGWPMGPAYLNDVIGMDTGTHVFSIIADGFPARLQRTGRDALNVMVESKRLGQKSGLGFYSYAADPAGKPRKSVGVDTHELLKSVQPDGTRDLPVEEIVERLMLPIIVEAAWCLEEAVVATPHELDMALLLGLGFPQYLGGALKYADWLGLSQVIALSERYAHLGKHYVVPDSLRALATAGKTFYG